MNNNRPKNYAPKEMEGTYCLTMAGNCVSMVELTTNKEAAVYCHPDDKFDIGEAIKLCMRRMVEDDIIRVGDTVEIVNNGDSYTTVSKWDNVDMQYAIRYRYGVCPNNGTIGKLVRIVNDKYIIQVKSENYLGAERFNYLYCYDCVYVMNKHGLKKIKDGRYE